MSNLVKQEEQMKGHKLEYGSKGQELTWQDPFPKEVTCVHCGKAGARLAFVLCEMGGDNPKEAEFACRLHPNKSEGPDGEGFWLHDAAAFATYLCRDLECASATTLWNQG